jgi:hypothetical protein
MYTLILASVVQFASTAPTVKSSIKIQLFSDADCQQPLKNATASAGKCITVDLENGYGSMALPANADIFSGCKWNTFVEGICLCTPNVGQGSRGVAPLEAISGFFDNSNTITTLNCFPIV